jgi:hypothetical protein
MAHAQVRPLRSRAVVLKAHVIAQTVLKQMQSDTTTPGQLPVISPSKRRRHVTFHPEVNVNDGDSRERLHKRNRLLNQLFHESSAELSRTDFRTMLDGVGPHHQTQALGQRLYNLIFSRTPALAGQITGMFLQANDTDALLDLIYSPQELDANFEAAMQALENHEKEATATTASVREALNAAPATCDGGGGAAAPAAVADCATSLRRTTRRSKPVLQP